MNFDEMSDEELLKPDVPVKDYSSMSDEDLLKPDIPTEEPKPKFDLDAQSNVNELPDWQRKRISEDDEAERGYNYVMENRGKRQSKPENPETQTRLDQAIRSDGIEYGRKDGEDFMTWAKRNKIHVNKKNHDAWMDYYRFEAPDMPEFPEVSPGIVDYKKMGEDVAEAAQEKQRVEMEAKNASAKRRRAFIDELEQKGIKEGSFVQFVGKDGETENRFYNGLNEDGRPVFSVAHGKLSQMTSKHKLDLDKFRDLMDDGNAKREDNPLESVRRGVAAEEGRDVGVGEAVATRAVPFVGRAMRDTAVEQMKNLSKLHEGDLSYDEVVPSTVPSIAGGGALPQTQTRRLGGVEAVERMAKSIWNDSEALRAEGEDEDAYIARVRERATGELKNRVAIQQKAGREEAQVEQGAVDKIVKGGVDSAGYALEFTIAGLPFAPLGPVGAMVGSAAIETAASAPSRQLDLTTPSWALDEKGNLVKTSRAMDEDQAKWQAIVGAAAENATEVALEAATLGTLRFAGGWLRKGAKAVAPKGVGAAEAKVAEFMQSDTGLKLMSIGKHYRQFSDRTQINAPWSELAEEHVQRYFDDVVGLGKKPDDYKGFDKESAAFWNDMKSLSYHADTLYGLLGQLAVGGAHAGLAASREVFNREKVDDEVVKALKMAGISDEAINSLDLEQRVSLCDLWARSKGKPETIKKEIDALDFAVRNVARRALADEAEAARKTVAERGEEPATFNIPVSVGKDGKQSVQFEQIGIRDTWTGQEASVRAVLDRKNGVGIVDRGDGLYEAVDTMGGSQVCDSLDDAINAAKDLAVTAQQRKSDREVKKAVIENERANNYGKKNVVYFNTIGDAATQIGGEIAQNGEAYGMSDISQLRDPKNVSRAGFHTGDGTTVVILDNVRSPNDIPRLLGHEIIGHGGANGEFGNSQGADKFAGKIRTDDFDSFKEASAQKHQSVTAGETIEQAREAVNANLHEVFAHYAADAERGKPNAFDRLAYAVNIAARKIGLKKTYSDADVRVLLNKWRESVKGTGGMTTGSNAERFAFFDVEQPTAPAETHENAPVSVPGEKGTMSRPNETAQPTVKEEAKSAPSKPVNERNIVEKLTDKAEAQEIPLSEVEVSDSRIPQFKEGADPETGEVEPLTGEPYDLVSNPIVVMEFKDGKKVVVTGRHRYGLYKRSGRKTIAARVIREADGWTVKDAMAIDAIGNIIDEKGTEKDYVKYFDEAKPTRDEAKSAGFLDRPKGQRAFSIYEGATADTKQLIDWEGAGGDGKISVDQAGIISVAAPKGANPRFGAVQRILTQKALGGLRGKKLGILARSLAEEAKNRKETPKVGGEMQLDLFTSEEDQALLAMEDKRADYRVKKSGEYNRIAEVLRTAVSKGGKLDLNGEYAKELGITDPKDKKQLIAARDKAIERANYWENAVVLDEADKTSMDEAINAKSGAEAAKREEIQKKAAEKLAAVKEKRTGKKPVDENKKTPEKVVHQKTSENKAKTDVVDENAKTEPKVVHSEEPVKTPVKSNEEELTGQEKARSAANAAFSAMTGIPVVQVGKNGKILSDSTPAAEKAISNNGTVKSAESTTKESLAVVLSEKSITDAIPVDARDGLISVYADDRYGNGAHVVNYAPGSEDEIKRAVSGLKETFDGSSVMTSDDGQIIVIPRNVEKAKSTSKSSVAKSQKVEKGKFKSVEEAEKARKEREALAALFDSQEFNPNQEKNDIIPTTKKVDAFVAGIASGAIRYPRFKPQEARASQGKEHGKLWSFILSLESAKVDGGRDSSFTRGKQSFSERIRETFEVISRMGSSRRGGPGSGFAINHKYLDRGVESTVYDLRNGFVRKIRKINPHSLNDALDILGGIVYHNYLFPKDAYYVRDIINADEDGKHNLYIVIDQKMVTPKTDATGVIIPPTTEQIFAALGKSPMKFSQIVDGGSNAVDSSWSDYEDNDDVVDVAKVKAFNGDFLVYDFQPGRNTFIDAKTGEVRFIDPRITINDPGENFSEASRYGKRKPYAGPVDFGTSEFGQDKQGHLSGGTSRNQNPAGNEYGKKWKIFKPGKRNVDIGAGRFEKATQFFRELGMENLPFDPVNRSSDVNANTVESVKANPADTATVHNVLNVIDNDKVIDGIINQAARAIKKNGTAIFTVYEGDKSGNGRETRDGWQRNERTSAYVPRIKKFFGHVETHGGVILAKQPKDKGPAFWAFDSTFENGIYFNSQEFDPEMFQKRVGAMSVIAKRYVDNGIGTFGEIVADLRKDFPDKFENMKPYLAPIWNVVARGMKLPSVSEEQEKRIYDIIESQKEAKDGETRTVGQTNGDVLDESRTADVTQVAEGGDAGGSPDRNREEQPVAGLLDGEGRRTAEQPVVGHDVVGRAGDISGVNGERGQGDAQEGRDASQDAGAVAGGRGSGAEERGVGLDAGEQSGVREGGSVAEAAHAASPDKPSNYVITAEDEAWLNTSTPAEKVANNMAVIKLLASLSEDGRMPTPEERTMMARYVGFGGFPQIVDQKYKDAYKNYGDIPSGELPVQTQASLKKLKFGLKGFDIYREMRQYLTPEEFDAIRQAMINAFYTPIDICRSMHNALKASGFNGGRMLETSAGTGNMVGTGAYDSVPHWTAIELDKTTGKILEYLYPEANVKIRGFQDVIIPKNFIDATISNVPFSNDIHPYDPEYAKYDFNLHDYFFAKTVDTLRPGGVAALISSTGTLDKTDKTLIRFMEEHGGQIVGALRLPNGHQHKNSGTEVAADLIFIQKVNGRADNSAFSKSGQLFGIKINDYFVQHPEMVFGTPEAGRSMYGNAPALKFKATRDPAELDAAIRKAAEGLKYLAPNETPVTEPLDLDANKTGLRKGNIGIVDGKVVKREGDVIVPIDVARMTKPRPGKDGKMHRPEWPEGMTKKGHTIEKAVQDVVRLRDAYHEYVEAQKHGDEESVKLKRASLNAVYDVMQSKYGHFNKDAIRKIFDLDDADGIILQNLEAFDEVDTGKKTKAGKPITKMANFRKSDTLLKRTLFRENNVAKADNVLDGLRISLNENGGVNLARIAELTGKTKEEVSAELMKSGHVFQNPSTGGLETRDEYLSGSVRRKLREARAASEVDPSFRKNIEELEKVQPEDKPATKIKYQLGQKFIPNEMYVQFLSERIFGTPENPARKVAVGYDEKKDTWVVSGEGLNSFWRRKCPDGTHLEDILVRIFNGSSLTVKDRVDDGGGKYHYVPNPQKTQAVEALRDDLTAELSKWMVATPERAKQIERAYNDKMNDNVERKFDTSLLTLDGISDDWAKKVNTPGYEHQKRSITRGVFGGNLYIQHCVGAGKSFEMFSICMQLRRLGLARKPMLTVPNHMVESGQVLREFKEAYPGANILVATTKDLNSTNRRKFLAKAANGDWDCIVVPHSSFSLIGMDPKVQADYIRQEIEDLREMVEAQAAEGKKKGNAEKRIEKKIASKMEKMKKLLDQSKKDSTVPFENIGVDYLFVDEAHNFKGLDITTKMSNVSGVTGSVSQRAQDLEMKCRYLSKLHGGDKGVIFASGTPISNSISESYTNARFMNPTRMREMGVYRFDDWAKSFGVVETKAAPRASGKGYQEKTRFARFQNLVELKQGNFAYADIVLDSDLNIPRPFMAGFGDDGKAVLGKPIVHKIPTTDFQKRYVESLDKRLDSFKGKFDPKIDNPLKVVTEGRLLAIDPALLGLKDEHRRLECIADNVFRIWQKSTGVVGKDKKTVLDGTQLIFCDSGVPKPKKFSKVVRTADGGFATRSGNYWALYVSDVDANGMRHGKAVRSDGVTINPRPFADHSQNGQEDISSVYAAFDEMAQMASEYGKAGKDEKGLGLKEYQKSMGYKVDEPKKHLSHAKEPEGEPFDINAWLDENADAVGYDVRFENPYATERSENLDFDEIEESAEEEIVEDEGDEDAPEKDQDEANNGDIAVENMLRGKFNIYAYLKKALVKRGIPAEEIVFIHDAEDAKAKRAMFEKFNADGTNFRGGPRILIGNTPKMGEGANVQRRLVAIHHADIPWKPAWLTQRDGRGIRAGNLNESIGIHRYVTENTFDVYSYDKVSGKQQFINQVQSHDMSQDEVEDVDDAVLAAEEAKAAAAGPIGKYMMAKTKLEQGIRKAELTLANQQSDIFNAQSGLEWDEQNLQTANRRLEADKAMLDKFAAAKGDQPFGIEVTDNGYPEFGRTLTDNDELQQFLMKKVNEYVRKGAEDGIVGKLYGMPVWWKEIRGQEVGRLTIGTIGMESQDIPIINRVAPIAKSTVSTFKAAVTQATSEKRLDRDRADVANAQKRFDASKEAIAKLKIDETLPTKIEDMKIELATTMNILKAKDDRIQAEARKILNERIEQGRNAEAAAIALAELDKPAPIERQLDELERNAAEVEFDSPEFNPVTPAEDAAYMNAVKRGDMENAARMVREAAAKAMPDTKVVGEDGLPLVVYHGSRDWNPIKSSLHIFDRGKTYDFGFHFGTLNAALSVSKSINRFLLNIKKPLRIRDVGINGWTNREFLKEIGMSESDISSLEEKIDFDDQNNSRIHSIIVDHLVRNGYDGLVYKNKYEDVGNDSFVAIRSSQIKSADPVTYDDAGSVIPLSQRFNQENADVRFDSPEFNPNADKPANPADDKTFGFTNEEVAFALKAAGMEPPKHVTKPDEIVERQADALLSNREYMRKLAHAVYQKNRATRDYENLALGIYTEQCKEALNTAKAAYDEMAKMLEDLPADTEQETVDLLKKSVKELKAQLLGAQRDFREAAGAKIGGASEQGRALRSNRILVDGTDYSYAGIRGMVEAELGGKPVSAEMDAEIGKLAENFKDLDERSRNIAVERLKAFSQKVVDDLKRGGKERSSGPKSAGNELKRVMRNYEDAMTQVQIHADEAGGTLIGLADQLYPSWGKWLKAIGEYHCYLNPDITEQGVINAIREDVGRYLEDGFDETTVRDILTGFGHNYRQSRYDSQRKMNDLKAQALSKRQRDYMIENGKLPPQTGMVRDEPSDETRALRKEVQQIKKDIDEQEGGPRALKGALSSAKTRLRNTIADLERAIANGEKIERSHRTLMEDAELQMLQRRRDELREQYDALFGEKATLTDEQRRERAEKALRKVLERALERLGRAYGGDFSAPARASRIDSPTIQALREEIAQTNRTIRDLKDAAYPEGTPEEITKKNARRMAAREDAIQRMQARIISGDIRPQVKKAPPMPPEMQERYDALGKELKRAHQKLRQLRQDAKDSLKPTWVRKIGETLRFMDGIQKMAMASLDFTQVGNQTGSIAVSHPIVAYRSFVQSLPSFLNETNAENIDNELLSDPLVKEAVDQKWLHWKRAGEFAENRGDRVEFFDAIDRGFKIGGRFLRLTDVPLYGTAIANSDRLYATYINTAAANLYSLIVKDTGLFPKGASSFEKRVVADMVNVMTGSGTLSKQTRAVLGKVMWAPGLVDSQFKRSIGYTMWHPFTADSSEDGSGTGSERAKLAYIGAKEFVRSHVGAMLLGGLMLALFGSDDEKYRFWHGSLAQRLIQLMAPRIGHTSFDFTGGEAAFYRLGEKLATGVKETGSGRHTPIRDYFGEIAHFVQGRINPFVGNVLYSVAGSDYANADYGPLEMLASFAPISIKEAGKSIYENGIQDGNYVSAAIAATLIMFGIGKGTYRKDDYKILSNRFREDFKEMTDVANDPLLSDEDKKDMIANMIKANNLLDPKNSGAVMSAVKAVDKEDRAVKKAEERLAVSEQKDGRENEKVRYELDKARARLEEAKQKVLRLIRERR